MRPGLICVCLFFVAALMLSTGPARAQSSDTSTFEVLLIWGTNDTKTDPKFKSADPKLAEKLRKTPFKWDHYCEMHREILKLKPNEERTVTLSRNCVISLTNLQDDQVKFQLFGKGKLANTVTQSLPKGQLLITGGDAENSTAWFVVLKKVE